MQLCRSGVFPVGLIFHDNMDSGIALQGNLPLRTVLFCRSQLKAQSADVTSTAGGKALGWITVSFLFQGPSKTLAASALHWHHLLRHCRPHDIKPTRKGLGR